METALRTEQIPQIRPGLMPADEASDEYYYGYRMIIGYDENGREQWNDLHLTKNQIGFEGVKRLALRLKPKVLIIRALGLECVVEKDNMGNLKYAPQKLSVIREAMELSLKEGAGSGAEFVIIPGRHRVCIGLEQPAP